MRRFLFSDFAIPLVALVAWLTPVRSASAASVTIDTVLVGNAGNAGDSAFPLSLPGAVAYDYSIGKFEVTVGQYAAFLNAVAKSDTYQLYNPLMATNLNVAGIARSGSPGSYVYSVIGSPNKPVTYVNWGDAARFANWLHNGQPTGPQYASTTEDGAYTLNGAMSNFLLGTIPRNPGADWFLPSTDEWYKAAYHKNDGVTGNYWSYPTATNAVPYSVQPPGSGAPIPSNTANYFSNDGLANGYNDGYAVTGAATLDPNQNYLNNVGAYLDAAGPYGTFDQGGNVFEWYEGMSTGFDGGLVWIRGLRGGGWDLLGDRMSSSSPGGARPESEYSDSGFRVATTLPVPEPSSLILLAMGGAGLLSVARRAFVKRAAGH